MTQTMKAGVATPDGLKLTEVIRPGPSKEEVLVRVRVAGMNRADLAAAKGLGVAGPDDFGKPIGMEWAGEVVALGSAVTEWRVGDIVACSGTGGYAEYAVADQHRLFPIGPAGDVTAAAILPFAVMTAYDAMTVASLQAEQSVFVRGASSGVGLAAMQVAKLRGASVVLGGARSSEKRARLPEFGADHSIDTSEPGWVDAVLATTEGAGADIVIDLVGGDDLSDLMRATAIRGRIVNVGRLGGTTTAFDLNIHALRRIAFYGTTFRTRSLAEIREIVAAVTDKAWTSARTGAIRLPLDSQFALDDAVHAHAYMADNRHFGKIALVI